MNEVVVFVADSSLIPAIRRAVAIDEDTTVVEVNTTAEMLAHAHPFSIILTDLLVAESKGVELIRQLRAGPLGATPVIVLTSAKNEQLAVEALREGASSYVPIRLIKTELMKTVSGVLSVAKAHRNRSRIKSCMNHWYCEFELANDRTLITPLVRYLQEMTENLGLLGDPNEETRVGIALEEALRNSMYHGNLEVSSFLREEDDAKFQSLIETRAAEAPYRDRKLRVKADLNRVQAVFEIRDEGPGFDVSTVPDPTDPANVERVCGRGMLLMRTFMDEVTYGENGNQVRLVKHGSGPRDSR